jgi:hypothetical protein
MQKLSTGQALQHRQREGGIEECSIGILEMMLQIRMARIMQNVQAR